MRNAIRACDKLALTLRFLAAGSSYKELMYAFRISDSSISTIVPEVCDAIYKVLGEDYCSVPKSKNDWLKIAQEFEEQWQFPNVIGSIDGKHVNIKCPPNSGSLYFNYKNQYSIVLLGIADAKAKFIAFDLGAHGSCSDGGILKNCRIGELCESENIPPPRTVGTYLDNVPYFLIGDEAFALSPNLMKPYPHRTAVGDEKIFNYRLSRARRIVENAFGVMSSRFRILLRTFELKVPNVILVTRACIALRNMLLTKRDQQYCPPGFMDSEAQDGTVTPGAGAVPSAASTVEQRGGCLEERNIRIHL